MTDQVQNNDIAELQSAIHAFKIVATVLGNSTFKPEHFQKVSITLSVVNDIMTELQNQFTEKTKVNTEENTTPVSTSVESSAQSTPKAKTTRKKVANNK